MLLEELALEVAATLELVALLPAPAAAAGVEDMTLLTVFFLSLCVCVFVCLLVTGRAARESRVDETFN